MFLEAYTGCPHSLLSRVPPDLLARTLEQLQHMPDQVPRCLAEMPCLLDGSCVHDCLHMSQCERPIHALITSDAWKISSALRSMSARTSRILPHPSLSMKLQCM